MEAIMYKVECITNLHVGSGEANYGIVDNVVETDAVTGQPVIFASGIKGALREHFMNEWKKNKEVDKRVIRIFGSEPGETKNQENSRPGEYKFLQAQLVARPLRTSKGRVSYALTTTKEILKMVHQLAADLEIKGLEDLWDKQISLLNCPVNQALADRNEIQEIEGISVRSIPNEVLAIGKKFVGENFAVMNEEDFANQDLPVLARNQLENKKSKNLWYEEYVPYKSVFYFSVIVPQRDDLFQDFHQVLTSQWIQFGANASIGYGLCKLSEVGGKNAN